MAKLVVFGALVLIAEHIVCFGGLFEFLLGFFVSGIFVGVLFEREFSVCFFDVGGRCVFGYAKYFIVVSLFVHDMLMLLSYGNFGVSYYLVIECIAFLYCVDNLSAQILRRCGDHGYGLVHIGIKLCSIRLDRLDTVRCKVFYKFVVDKLHSFFYCRCVA